MGATEQNAMDYAVDMVRRGEVANMAEANVEVIRMVGVREIAGRVPREIRNALNAAVKAGRLGHLKKDELMPEVFFHPNSRARAIELRNRRAIEKTNALRKALDVGYMNSA